VNDRPQGRGWYDDPQDPNAQRYWDGQDWTPHRQRKPVARQAQMPVTSTPPPLPPPPAANVPPPPPPSNLPPPPTAPRVKSGASKVWVVAAGLALLLIIAALVAGRVLLGSFLPGLLLVAVIAIIGATVAIRSDQSVARKAMTVTAIALVVAAAVPASLKVVYPAYHHFFNDSTSQASPSTGSPSAQASPTEQPSPPSGSPSAQVAPPSQSPRSGILALTSAPTKKTYGFIDPSSGQYSEVVTFNIPSDGGTQAFENVAASPDLTKYAFTKKVSDDKPAAAGWLDSAGKFTAATPSVTPGAFGGNSPEYTAIGFDGAGNFYYRLKFGDVYKLAAGSTTNATKVTVSGDSSGPFLGYDGNMLFCHLPNLGLLGPNAMVETEGNQLVKQDIKSRDDSGCPSFGDSRIKLLPATNTAQIDNGISNRDGTQVAFKYHKADGTSLYIVGADGGSEPKPIQLSNITEVQLAAMTFLKWL
jgi:hypothetical protein